MTAGNETAPPAGETETGVTFVRPERGVKLPSFAAWLASMSFAHESLTARQLDSMLGLFLSGNLD